jgi:hypothetical protein
MVIDPSGFATAVNNIPGYHVTSVAVNGADLDILLWTGNNVLVAEAAAGARDIRLVCRSVFAYCGAANAAGFGGYTDWGVPNTIDLISIANFGPAAYTPDAVAFPTWATGYYWSSNSRVAPTTDGLMVGYNGLFVSAAGKSLNGFCALVR